MVKAVFPRRKGFGCLMKISFAVTPSATSDTSLSALATLALVDNFKHVNHAKTE